MSASATTSFLLPKPNQKTARLKGYNNTNGRMTMIRTIAAISAALIWTALSVVSASAADKVVLMLNWYVYGEHAPFYYGKAKGIFAAEGIDLEIQEGRGSAETA